MESYQKRLNSDIDRKLLLDEITNALDTLIMEFYPNITDKKQFETDFKEIIKMYDYESEYYKDMSK